MKSNNAEKTNQKYSVLDFEKEVLDSSNMPGDKVIHSTDSFLFDYWNIFYHSYIKNVIKEFKKRGEQTYNPDLIKNINLTEIIKNNSIFNYEYIEGQKREKEQKELVYEFIKFKQNLSSFNNKNFELSKLFCIDSKNCMDNNPNKFINFNNYKNGGGFYNMFNSGINRNDQPNYFDNLSNNYNLHQYILNNPFPLLQQLYSNSSAFNTINCNVIDSLNKINTLHNINLINNIKDLKNEQNENILNNNIINNNSNINTNINNSNNSNINNNDNKNNNYNINNNDNINSCFSHKNYMDNINYDNKINLFNSQQNLNSSKLNFFYPLNEPKPLNFQNTSDLFLGNVSPKISNSIYSTNILKNTLNNMDLMNFNIGNNADYNSTLKNNNITSSLKSNDLLSYKNSMKKEDPKLISDINNNLSNSQPNLLSTKKQNEQSNNIFDIQKDPSHLIKSAKIKSKSHNMLNESSNNIFNMNNLNDLGSFNSNDINYFGDLNPKLEDNKSYTEVDNDLEQRIFSSLPKSAQIYKDYFKMKIKGLLGSKRTRYLKNNKLVFIQDEESIKNKEKNKIFNINDKDLDELIRLKFVEDGLAKERKPRGSRYRGVSKNGGQWQVLIMINKKKRYVGSYSTELEAAKFYDKVALQNHGKKAKTNFYYTEKEINQILSMPSILKE